MARPSSAVPELSSSCGVSPLDGCARSRSGSHCRPRGRLGSDLGRASASRSRRCQLRRTALRRRVDPSPLDRARLDQHPAVGRGVVRRNRSSGDMASPCRHHGGSAPCSSHLAVEELPHGWIREIPRCRWSARTAGARCVGNRPSLAVGLATLRPARRRRRAGASLGLVTRVLCSAATSDGGPSTG